MKRIQSFLIAMALPLAAQQKVSERTRITGAEIDPAADLLPVTDISAGALGSKAMTIGELVNVPSFFTSFPSGAITLSKLAQSGATTGQAAVWNGSAWAPATVTSNLTSGPVTSSGGVSSIADGAIATSKLAQSGATTGQAPIWNGSAWTPGTVSGGAWGGITGTLSSQADVYDSLKNRGPASDYLPWTSKYLMENKTSSNQMILHTMSEGDSWLSGVRVEDGLDSLFGWFGEVYQAANLTLAGGATLASQHTKYSIGSPSGQTVSLTASGHTATMARAGGRLPPAFKLMIAYRQQSGGGVFQPQIFDTTGTWVNAGSTVNTSGSDSIIWYEYSYEALTGFAAAGTQVRAVWSSGGTVEIVAIGVTNSAANAPGSSSRQGVIGYNAAFQGSTAAMWDTIPQAAWNSTLAYLKTNIVFLRDYRETTLYGNNPAVWLSTLQSVMTKMQTGRKSASTASLVFGSGTSVVTLTAVSTGIAGEAVTVKFLKAGLSTSLTTTVSGNAITVNLATDGSGNATSTAAQVVTSINGAASSLVTASGSGSGTCGSTSGFLPLSCGVGIDFVMIGTHPTGPQYESDNILSDNAMRQFCQDNRILFIDARSYFPTTFADSMKQGFQNIDELHLTNSGNQFLSSLIARKTDLWKMMTYYEYGKPNATPSFRGSGVDRSWRISYDSASGDTPVAFLGFSRTNGGTVNQSDGWGMTPATRASAWLSEGAKESIGGVTYRQIDGSGQRQVIGYNTEVTRQIGGLLELGNEIGSATVRPNLVLTGITGQTAAALEVRSAGSPSSAGTLTATIKPDGQAQFVGCTLPPTTVAALPASPATNTFATVNNASAFTAGGTVAGGGSVKCLVQYDGAAWKMVLQLY